MTQSLFKTELHKTFKLAYPIIIAQLGVVLMGVSDNIIVGKLLDKIALGAAGIANSIGFLIASMAVGGMSVLAPMVSKRLAEKKEGQLEVLFNNSIWVCILYSFVLSLVGFIVYKNFSVLQQSAHINAIAPQYFLIIIASNIPLIFFLGIKQFADGMSKPKVAMVITMIGLLINIFLNISLIKGGFFFPKMGFLGSAMATFLTRSIMLACLWGYFKKSKSIQKYFSKVSLMVDFASIKLILKRSIPGGFQIFFEIAAFSVAIVMMGWISDTALAAHQIAINIASITYMMASGFAYAGSIRVGENWGTKSIVGIRTAAKVAYLVVGMFMMFAMLIIIGFDSLLLKGFINDPEVIQQAIPLLTIAAYFQLSDGFQVVGLGILRGLADIKIPTFITFIAYWMIALPGGYLLGFYFGYGAKGIWYGLLLGLSFSAAFLFYRYQNISSNLHKRLNTSESQLS